MIDIGGVCFTPAEYAALGQQIADRSMQFGMFMIVVGVLIGYLAPKAGKYIKERLNGRTPE